MQDVPTLLAVLMANCKKPLNATIGWALARILPNQTRQSWLFWTFHREKDMLAPNNNRGMTYQTDGNHISKTIRYLVGVVKLSHYCFITRFIWCVITR
jgi:hypothetical protein